VPSGAQLPKDRQVQEGLRHRPRRQHGDQRSEPARLEPSYKQHGVVDDACGVVLDVEVTTGEVNEGQVILERLDAAPQTTGAPSVVTADAGYAYAKVFGGLERREIAAVIPAKKEPIRSPVPLRRFRYDARHDIVKCPRGKILRPGRPVNTDGSSLPGARLQPMRSAALCLSKSRVNKASSSATTIRRCCGRDGAASAGARRRPGSTSATAGARRASTARRRPGTASPAPCAEGSTTCASSPS
jgi:hypothetical protein